MLAVYCDLHLWPADLKVNSDVLLINYYWPSVVFSENYREYWIYYQVKILKIGQNLVYSWSL